MAHVAAGDLALGNMHLASPTSAGGRPAHHLAFAIALGFAGVLVADVATHAVASAYVDRR